MTETGPEVAAGGTTAVIRESESTANTAGTPLKLTAVAPSKRLPASVTWVPGSPNDGVTAVSSGGATV
jgi:hypothetical protein